MNNNLTYHQHQPINPKQLMANLVTGSFKCNQNHSHHNETLSKQSNMKRQTDQQHELIEQTKTTIINLENHLNAIESEVYEVQNMLSYRDVLYHQLQHLKVQRQEIQDQILGISEENWRIQKNKKNDGLKQINMRLKRRIKQMGEYINKMDTQNNKLERAIDYNYYSPPQTKIQIHTEPIFPTSYKTAFYPNWSYQNTPKQTIDTFDDSYFENFRKELKDKENNSWKRIQQKETKREINQFNNITNIPQNNIYAKYRRRPY